MKRYLVAPEAEDDLQQIWRYLLKEAGLSTADRIQEGVISAFEKLAEVPGKGHKCSDLTSRAILLFTVYQYMIVYRQATPLEIVAVLHGKRNLKALFKSRTPR